MREILKVALLSLPQNLSSRSGSKGIYFSLNGKSYSKIVLSCGYLII